MRYKITLYFFIPILMWKRSKLSLILLISCIAYLSGCTNTKTPEIANEAGETTRLISAKAFLETLAPTLDKTVKDITPQAFSWGSINEELSGYLLSNTNIKSNSGMQEKIDQAFEGWVEKSVGDGVWESYVEYLKDNLICSVYSKVNYNPEETTKTASSDEKDSNKKKETSNELEKISTENSQSLEVHCAEFNEKNPSPLEFSFDLFGEEPFWNAELRASSLTYTIPNDETNQFNTDSTYIWFWGTSGGTLIFTGEKYNLGGIAWEISKENCIDSWIGNKHAYKAKIRFWATIFEGCADKVDNFLVEGRKGIAENLFKKINYNNYRGKLDPKTALYNGIQTKGNLVEIFLTQKGKEHTEYLVLGKTDDGRKTYWQGEVPIDAETCEKYLEVPGLMDFGIFNSCPRG